MAESKSEEPTFIDAEEYTNYKQEQQFNHQSLVMETMRKCIEAGTHEMMPGWFNEKSDKFGNINRTYIEDTRSKFIECVKTLEMVMICDFDSIATINIKNLFSALSIKKKSLLAEQDDWFKKLDFNSKNKAMLEYGTIYFGMFNINLGWWQMYLEFELNIYRMIFKELTNLTKRLGFYASRGLVE